MRARFRRTAASTRSTGTTMSGAPHEFRPRDTFVPPGPFGQMTGFYQGLTTPEIEMRATPATCRTCGRLEEDAIHAAGGE